MISVLAFAVPLKKPSERKTRKPVREKWSSI